MKSRVKSHAFKSQESRIQESRVKSQRLLSISNSIEYVNNQSPATNNQQPICVAACQEMGISVIDN